MKRLIQGLTALALLGTPAVAAADPGDIVGIEIASVDLDDDMVGDNIYGYWEYLPTAYDTVGEPWPMFIFLSGIGENGNGLLPPGGCSGPGNPGSYLCRNLRHGPQSHLWDQIYGPGALNEWDEEERPFIVISPQNPAPPLVFGNPYDAEDMNEFLDYLIDAYNVDPRRIYLTGMSMGGYSVSLNLVEFPGRYAAASMLPGIGAGGAGDPCNVGRTALWSFHGDLDQAGSGAFDPGPLTTWMASVRDCPEPHPDVELTMYVNAGHNVWSRTIDPLQGQDDPVYEEFPYQGGMLFDTIPYEPDIYTWLLQYDLPEVSAGPDFEVTTDEDSFEILAFITDDDPVEFTWTQTGGDPLTLTDADTQTLTVSDLVEGEYTFNVFALDADDQYDSDEVTITIVPGMGGGSESETEGSSSSSTGGDGSSSGGSGSSSTGGGDAGLSTSTGADDSTSGATSTSSGGPSGSGSASESDSDSDPSAGSASDSASGGSASDSNGGSATATTGDSAGAETDSDSDGGGASSDSGGCTVGGSRAPSVWMLGLFGFIAVRRRR